MSTRIVSKFAVGETVVISNGASGRHESNLGVGVVKSISIKNQVTIYKIQLPNYGRMPETMRYDPRGWSKGSAVGCIRPLAAGETAESVLAPMLETIRQRQEAKKEKQLDREAELSHREEAARMWIRRTGNCQIDELSTPLGIIYTATLAIPNRTTVLVIRLDDMETLFGEIQCRASIMVNEQRAGSRTDSGITSVTVKTADADEVVVQWLREWHRPESFV